jgi:hypothetical protein
MTYVKLKQKRSKLIFEAPTQFQQIIKELSLKSKILFENGQEISKKLIALIKNLEKDRLEKFFW